MSNRSKQSLLIFVFCLAAMLIIPPWQYSGYQPIFVAPLNETLDWSRLALQSLILAAVVFGIYLSNSSSPQEGPVSPRDRFPQVFYTVGLLILLAVAGTWSYVEIQGRQEQALKKKNDALKFAAKEVEKRKLTEKLNTDYQQREIIDRAVQSVQSHRKLAELVTPKKWQELEKVCPGVKAILQTAWKDGSFYYRVQFVGGVEALEYVRAKSHRFEFRLFDSALQPVFFETLDSRDLGRQKDKAGLIYGLSTRQLGRPMDKESYEGLNSWELLMKKNRREVE